jgi:quercetin dioxygenase-like cupin family protein
MPHTTVWRIPAKRIDRPNERNLQVLYSAAPDAARGGFLVHQPDATVLVSTIYPQGGRTGVHTHPVDELIYVISGRGYGTERGDRFVIEPGTVIFAQANVEHDCVNLSTETMQLLCVYLPALPQHAVEALLDGVAPPLEFPEV